MNWLGFTVVLLCAAALLDLKGCYEDSLKHDEEMARIRYARPAWCCPCDAGPCRDGGAVSLPPDPRLSHVRGSEQGLPPP